jgi:hypothetical protein
VSYGLTVWVLAGDCWSKIKERSHPPDVLAWLGEEAIAPTAEKVRSHLDQIDWFNGTSAFV